MGRAKSKTRKPKESSVLIRIPAELARDIFRESGDLQFSKFPATMTLVESNESWPRGEKEVAETSIFLRDKETCCYSQEGSGVSAIHSLVRTRISRLRGFRQNKLCENYSSGRSVSSSCQALT